MTKEQRIINNDLLNKELLNIGFDRNYCYRVDVKNWCKNDGYQPFYFEHTTNNNVIHLREVEELHFESKEDYYNCDSYYLRIPDKKINSVDEFYNYIESLRDELSTILHKRIEVEKK